VSAQRRITEDGGRVGRARRRRARFAARGVGSTGARATVRVVGHVRQSRRPPHRRRFVGERATLVGFLRDQRLTLELKCSGLDAADLARRSEPSNLSLLGLVRHLAGVEQEWFRLRMAGEDAAPLFSSGEDFDGAIADPEVVEEAWATWRAEVEFAERFVAQAPDLGALGKAGDPVREVLVHMIDEYARHNGHADFLRERIDFRIGQ
jgi:Protein of unknown function (DUF664)